jgi:hypothetical protein
MAWMVRNLTKLFKARFTFAGITGYDFPDNKTMHVVYSATKPDNDFYHNEVRELYASADLVWHTVNLTVDSGSETAFSDAYGYLDDTDGNQHAIFIGSPTANPPDSGRIKEIFWKDAEKTPNDLTDAANAHRRAETPPTGYGPDFGTQNIFYQGTDSHLWHLERQFGGDWTSEDLTFTKGAPELDYWPNAFKIAPGTVNVVYREQGTGSVILFSRDGNGNWIATDFTKTVGAALASHTVVGIANGKGYFIHYCGVDQHLHQISWTGNPDDMPIDTALTALLGIPAMENATEPNNYLAASDQTFHIIYHALDGALHEIYGDGSPNWQSRNMFQGNTAGEPTRMRRAAFVFSQDNIQRVVYSQVKDGHILELTWHPDRKRPWDPP